jgi:RNA polymerase sigma-70 factor (TIGR02960 family)
VTGTKEARGWKDRTVTTELVALAKGGDGEAFSRLVDPYRRELQVHCYRILGSASDAEDMLQETMLSAWQAIRGFEERASIRTWLYRIATRRCLNSLRSASRRPASMESPLAWTDPPEPARVSTVGWLEPYPDVLLQGIADIAPGPDARYESTEAISLAFITALQLLPPRQRAVVILRDVLGFRPGEVAQILETTNESVTSAHKRARTTLEQHRGASPKIEVPPIANSPNELELVERLTQAFGAGDLNGIVALLTEDVWLSMPPIPFEYQGRAVAAQALSTLLGTGRTYRLVPTRANGQPAFGVYVRDPHVEILHANGLMVLTLAGDKISAITRFDNSALARFGLPRNLIENNVGSHAVGPAWYLPR